MAKIVVIGEILVEIMATEIGQTFLLPGQFEGPYPSGAPAIFADQAARTGADVALVGSVGKDDFGTVSLQRLQSSGVDTSRIQRHPHRPTGSAFVTYAKDGSRSFVFNIAHSAAACVSADQLDPALFAGCRFFHIMGSSLIGSQMTQSIRHGIDLAKATGAEISFDPNVRKELLSSQPMAETIREILSKADILLPSEDDLKYLFADLAEPDAVHQLLAGSARSILLKRGRNGCTYFDREQKLDVPPIIAEEVDPTGAGDCFGGTFISCLAQEFPLPCALSLANAAGSLAVRKRGPMEGNSTLEQLNTCLENESGQQNSVQKMTRHWAMQKSLPGS